MCDIAYPDPVLTKRFSWKSPGLLSLAMQCKWVRGKGVGTYTSAPSIMRFSPAKRLPMLSVVIMSLHMLNVPIVEELQTRDTSLGEERKTTYSSVPVREKSSKETLLLVLSALPTFLISEYLPLHTELSIKVGRAGGTLTRLQRPKKRPAARNHF